MGNPTWRTLSALSGRKTAKTFRDPFEYAEVLNASGINFDKREVAARYYRERAIPYLIPFPAKKLPRATDPIPEGLDVWDVASPIDRVDWLSTMLTSPVVIPGVTTRERLTGDSPGNEPEKQPFDLYVGIDCSGSMGDPAHQMSYPVLAGAIVALSALRAGSRVKVVLSGEPGRTISTEGFIRDQKTVLGTLVKYLGTAILRHPRLADTFIDDKKESGRSMLIERTTCFQCSICGGGRRGWDVARESLGCGGGGTFVLPAWHDVF